MSNTMLPDLYSDHRNKQDNRHSVKTTFARLNFFLCPPPQSNLRRCQQLHYSPSHKELIMFTSLCLLMNKPVEASMSTIY